MVAYIYISATISRLFRRVLSSADRPSSFSWPEEIFPGDAPWPPRAPLPPAHRWMLAIVSLDHFLVAFVFDIGGRCSTKLPAPRERHSSGGIRSGKFIRDRPAERSKREYIREILRLLGRARDGGFSSVRGRAGRDFSVYRRGPRTCPDGHIFPREVSAGARGNSRDIKIAREKSSWHAESLRFRAIAYVIGLIL